MSFSNLSIDSIWKHKDINIKEEKDNFELKGIIMAKTIQKLVM
jgi:hypothetical protein